MMRRVGVSLRVGWVVMVGRLGVGGGEWGRLRVGMRAIRWEVLRGVTLLNKMKILDGRGELPRLDLDQSHLSQLRKNRRELNDAGMRAHVRGTQIYQDRHKRRGDEGALGKWSVDVRVMRGQRIQAMKIASTNNPTMQ